MSVVLLCDDEPAVRFALRELLEDRGHDVRDYEDARVAVQELDDVDVVLTDLSMPHMDGLSFLRVIKEKRSDLPVIMITARGSERAAVSVMKAGAFDYLTKPFDVDEVTLAVARAAEHADLRREAKRALAERTSGRLMIGESPAMRALLERIARVAPRDVTVLVRGETGTGKELVAGLLHAQSPRAHGPLVRFNCAALPSELAESELFGHERGAFTGAIGARKGFFERAHGGTLVLDEVGELPLPIQAKLLRAVQLNEILPVGASQVRKVDVRIVACTHRDLLADTKTGRFREDLYFRLAVVELDVPPLSARREDIPRLARAFAAQYAQKFGAEDVVLSEGLLHALSLRPWPGNVRELENAVARIVALSDEGQVGEQAVRLLSSPTSAVEPHDTRGETFRERVEAFEKTLIVEALAHANGNRSEAARKLGMSRVTMLDRMKRLGIDVAG